jgi:hypothetical protein
VGIRFILEREEKRLSVWRQLIACTLHRPTPQVRAIAANVESNACGAGFLSVASLYITTCKISTAGMRQRTHPFPLANMPFTQKCGEFD